MKAYLINAKDELIVEVDCKDYHHKLELLNCRMLEATPIGRNNDTWIDEEGNLKESNNFFSYTDIDEDNDYSYLFSGNGIILGLDWDSGDCVEPYQLTLEQVKSKVTFMGKRYIDHDKLFSNFKVEEW